MATPNPQPQPNRDVTTTLKAAWEIEAAENRLTQSHHLALRSKDARLKKSDWMKEITAKLRTEISQWKYIPQLAAPDVEVAWIIYSHIAWQNNHSDPNTLFELMPETDPLRILEVEAYGPEADSPIPTETVRLLHNLLIQLEKFGVDIKEATFSQNWICPKRGSTKGKNGMPKGTLPQKSESKKIPKQMHKSPKAKAEGGKKPKKILASFFNLGDKR